MKIMFMLSALLTIYYLLLKINNETVHFSSYFLYIGLLGMTISLWEIYGSFSLIALFPKPILSLIWLMVLIGGLGFVVFLVGCYHSWHQKLPNHVQVIFVFGAGLHGCKLSHSLKARLDKAYECALNHPDAMIIVSGGQGKDEWVSEAKAMKDYLVQVGIDEKRIIMEDQSTTTYENLSNSLKLFDFRFLPTILVTNSFHLLRCVKMARKMGILAYGIGAPVSPLVAVVFYTREYLAFIKAFLYQQV